MAKPVKRTPIPSNEVHWLEGNDVPRVGLRVVGNGETLYFQSGVRWFFSEMSAVEGSIILSNVRRWSDGSRISDGERDEIMRQVTTLYTKNYSVEPILL